MQVRSTHFRPRALLAVALLAIGFAAHAGRLPATVAQALRTAAIPVRAVAVWVQEVGASRPRLSVNANRPMNPASVMKLLTTYAALDSLGPAHTWHTRAWALREPEGGVLAGDLYLQGGGDPALTFERFWRLLRGLRARGVTEIRGDLVLDRSLFAPGATGPFDSNPLRAYNAAPDALLLNFGAIRFSFVPRLGAVGLRWEPQPDGLAVDDRLVLSDGPCGEWKDDIRIERRATPRGVEVAFTGPYPAACSRQDWNLALLEAPQFVFGVFRELWRELGGRFSGGLREAPVPADATMLAEVDSAPLAEIVRDINKWSNNVMARQLYLSLGAKAGAHPAREADARAAIRDWLDAKGLEFPELVIENGSGLSRRARLSAASTASLMRSAWESAVMPEFIASLPIAGRDGTMRKRLRDNAVTGQAHVKTGTIEGVRTIAGYVLGRSGRRWIVVFFVDSPNAAAARPAQDALIEWVRAR